MGCGASDLNPAKKGGAEPRKRKAKNSSNKNQPPVGAAGANPLMGAAGDDDMEHNNQNAAGENNNQNEAAAAAATTSLLGKQRYIADNGAVVMAREEISSGMKGVKGHLIVFTNEAKSNLVFVYQEMGVGAGAITANGVTTTTPTSGAAAGGTSSGAQHHNSTHQPSQVGVGPGGIPIGSGPLFVKEFRTDDELTKAKADAKVHLSWAPFFKSIASDVIKSKAVMANPSPNARTATFTIVTSKDPNIRESFTVRMDLLSRSPNARELATYVMQPFIKMTQTTWTKDYEKELRIARAATTQVVKNALLFKNRDVIQRLRVKIEPLRQEASAKAHESRRLAQQLSLLEVKLNRTELGDGGNILDRMYSAGGPLPFPHAHFAAPHLPRMPTVNEPLATFIAKSLSKANNPNNNKNKNGGGGDVLEHSSASDMANEYAHLAPLPAVLRAPTDPALTKIYNIVPTNVANNVMQALHKLEDWDYNVFDMERHTQGNGLFFTCYAILNRLELTQHFNIDDKVLQNLLRGVQAGYHPNPYHNKTHAADVCQINYYVMMKGGLIDKCKMTKEDLLAAILAGAIHDYDHPGFNNSLHTKTNSYLATLYNDRSILENHHLACVFEMMRLPQFDIFKSLSDEQRRQVRETMIEMVLATDMGNHARIFENFKRTLSTPKDWTSKETKTEAMCMSLKLADISNCSRPRHLYMEWAKNISAEFFQQGDAEGRLGLPISPFMDRRREQQDFPQGQISFMNFIVMPMLEVMSELLPELEPTVALCQKNKDEWQTFLKSGRA